MDFVNKKDDFISNEEMSDFEKLKKEELTETDPIMKGIEKEVYGIFASLIKKLI